MKKILARFKKYWNRTDTKAIACERLEFLIERDRDRKVEEKAKEVKGKIIPIFRDVTEEIKYEIKFTNQKAEMVVHIPLFTTSEIKEEKYEHCVNCQ